jgi:RimJ/RimL family protein N-acetyltransferase
VTYAGKKFSGQRNHVNKFKKLYPDYEFCQLSLADIDEMTEFLRAYETRQLAKGTLIAKEELESVYSLLPHIEEFGLDVGALKVGGKIIALAIGERCGDQLIVHVEKGNTDYEGVYPTMAQEFAKCFVTDNIKYINREDDAGDPGLRKSKLQYNPIYLVDKYDLFPKRVIDRITQMPILRSQRLVIRRIAEADAEQLFLLEQDEERNKLWGYSWREHTDTPPTPQMFLQGVRQDYKNRDEMPLGIYLKGKMIGEVVLHKFGYRNDCEVGMRLLPEYEGNGYAKEAVEALIGYAFYTLNMEVVRARCHKINERSKKTLLSVGMRQSGEDETFYYFYKTAAM